MEMGFLISLIAIIILLLLSAFFSGSETAFTAASRVRLHSKEKAGDKNAALVNRIRDKKDRMIGALLLGNNLVNIMASALATSVLIKIFGEAGVVYATLVMTMLVLIFAEVLPKTYALHHAESMAVRIAPLVRFVVFVFAPVTEAVTWIVRAVLRLFGIDISRVAKGSHLELLRGAIEMHDGPEEETQEQRAMLRSILDLANVDVADIMVHRRNVTMLDSRMPIQELVKGVPDSPYTRMPIWTEDQDNITGIIHVKQLLREIHACEGDLARVKLDHIMLEPRFVPETTTLYDQLQAFREGREHFGVVVDEYGSFMGIVTLEDILEEIVGEIDDEHDENVIGVRREKKGVYMVDGTTAIRDLNREFGWKLPDTQDYSTLAGLILHEAQTLPEQGQSFRFHGFRFDIVRRHRHQISKIRVSIPKS